MDFRRLPSVDVIARDEALADLPRQLVVEVARETLDRARAHLRAGDEPGDLVTEIREEAAARTRPRLKRVINATGVILHTNLGRAPLASPALERIHEVAGGYSNLEFDLERGQRGSRHEHLAAALRRLTGAQDAIAVNNNAAAVLLALAALAHGREAVVSRGELIEIGDGFRIPEILGLSGARLVEVGTTNRTRMHDYERAIGAETAALLRVHPSNFRTVGFTSRPALGQLVSLAREHEIVVIEDLGSGAVLPFGDEPTVPASLAAGVDVVCFSGDKLLGGPQAGIVAGRKDLIERLRRHPLQRALRPDKLALAALEGTLLLYADAASAAREIPVLAMLREPLERVRARAAELADLVGGKVVETVARAGGGTLPAHEIPSAACAVEAALEQSLRSGEPSVISIQRDGMVLLDCRTVRPGELDEVARAVRRARQE